MEKSIDIFAYVIDNTAICNKIMQKLAKGAQGRLVLDRSNFLTSSCARQAERVKELAEAGCAVRTLRPKQGVAFAVMHAKTFIVDGRVVFLGSTNLTHNGLENNKEHLLKIYESIIVDKIAADFEETWNIAEEVTQQGIDEMMERDRRRKLKKHEKEVQGRAKASRNSRSARRSPSESADQGLSE